MHPSVIAILVFLAGLMVFRVVHRVIRALVGLRIVEAAKACSCGYSMAGIPFGVCPECGRPHDATALRPLGRPRLILASMLAGWTVLVILGSWGAFVALGAIFPPTETSRQSLTLNSTAGDIRFEWMIHDPHGNAEVDHIWVDVRETKSLPGIKPIHDSITHEDLSPPARTPDEPAHVDEFISSIVDGAGELAPADRAALAGDLRGIIEGALKGNLSSVLVPTAARARLYWGSGSGVRPHVVPRVEASPFLPAGLLAWTGGAYLIVRRWEARVKA